MFPELHDSFVTVPDDVFTGDGEVQTSYDSYNPVIDLTETEDDDINEIVDLRAVENSLSDGKIIISITSPISINNTT